MHLLFFSFSFGSSHSLFHPFYHSTFPRSLSLSLHPYSPPRGRPSFAPHVDESQTRPTVTGRALNWAEGANAKVLPRFSPPTRKGNDPLFVRGKEREREERMEGGGGRAAIRRPVNSWVYVTCYGHGSVVRWLDEGGWTYNVYRGKDDRAEPHTASLTSVCKHNHHGIPPAVLDLLANSTVSLSLAPRTEWKIQRLNGKTFYHLWISAFGKLSKFLHFYKNEYPFLILF